ncbi:MAG: PhzF family phenazine biosynthesis protein [Candidatus Eisenbacteria bacterium]|nr:PhzF family phenazine biosynthesis protein [Candidatus Eisenbacteria bacterium]
MPIPIHQVDAFTAEPFRGNPAAVCLLPAPRDEAWMQAVAAEMNLAETAFLVRRADGFDLRWFTPEVEVDLCGHATLASAHMLWETGLLKPGEPARFHTRSGLLTAERRGEEIELNFPSTPPQPADLPPGLAEALGATPKYTGKSRFDYLVEVATEAEVRSLRPDHAKVALAKVRGVMVTAAASTAGFDFVSRFFAPGSGIAEDPVTGSAHCCLTPFWSARLGKTQMMAWQASKRGGALRVTLDGDRVRLGGRAVTVLRGELLQRLR